MDLTQSTLIDVRDAIAGRKLGAEDVTRAYLERIEQLNPALNAYSEVYAQRALARAAAVDRGEVTGPLAGVPIALKDVLCTDWGKTTCSSKMLENFHAPYTATAVQRLEAAGAVVLGKTIMDEFAMGSSTEHSAFGPVRNPWDQRYVPGGSSGGAAAAVAADLCAGSIGSDTGGSIRQPAAYCGVTGLKPTYGRISRHGLVAFASSLDQIGPFGRTVADVALLTQVMAGSDPHDSTCGTQAVEDYLAAMGAKSDRPMRIGLARQYLSDQNHPAVMKAVNEAIGVYRKAGAEMVDIDLPHTEFGIPCYYIVATAEASSNLARYDGVHYGHRTKDASDLVDLYARSRAEGFGDEVKRRIMLGTYALSSGYYDAFYLKALKVRRLIQQDFLQAFERCDALLCPTTPGPAFRFGDKVDEPLAMYLADVYTVNCNLAGLPGISLPGGIAAIEDSRTKEAVTLPVGVQLMGRPWGEADLLRLAAVYQQHTDYHTRRPATG